MLLWYVISVASDYCAVNNNIHSTLFVRYLHLGTHLQKRQHRRRDFKVLGCSCAAKFNWFKDFAGKC